MLSYKHYESSHTSRANSLLQQQYYDHAGGFVVFHERLIAFLVPATLGYLLIRLRGRRPPSSRLARHSGFVAATVATATIMLGFALMMARVLLGLPQRLRWLPWTYDFYPSVGYVVMGSWLGLVFTGRWKRDRLWFEVPGLILGACWIATALIEWFGLALRVNVYRT